MKPGDIVEWMDEGPAIILATCEIPAPCLESQLVDFLANPDSWPMNEGWTIKLLLTSEIIDVHEETLEAVK